jgi:hypothetical protein
MDANSGNWRPLATAYGDGAACPPREAVVLVAALLADLGRLHRAGAVHGAVDPAHVLVAGGGRARLVEAGRDAAAPAFLAPEIHAGQPATARGDLFSAGVVLYRLLTGMNPFEGSAALVRQRVTNMIAPPPSEMKAGVGRAFDGIVEKAMAKKPEDRFASAEAFAEALMTALIPGATGEAGGDDTLATTVVRRPAPSADATVMRGPGPDATVMKAPSPDATVMKAPDPDATVVRRPAAPTTPTAATPKPTPAPDPSGSGGKGIVIGLVAAAIAAGAAAAFFLIK